MRDTSPAGPHADLLDELVAMSALAGTAMARATEALVRADLTLAEQVIAEDAELGRRGRWCEDRACRAITRHAPLAGELRMVVTTIKAAEKIERMGDLARHVAELVRMRHPEPVLPADLVPHFARMGRLAVRAGRQVELALGRRARYLERFADQAVGVAEHLDFAVTGRIPA